MPTFRSLIPAICLTVVTEAPAWAQTAPADANAPDILVTGTRDPLALPTSTGSRLGISILQTPASVAVVDGDTLRARGDINLLDAVTRAPGITNVANPGNGGTALSVRGFSGQGSVLQLVDGIRLYPVAGTITFPTDPWTVDRVEILNGPASVLYGQGAIGGAVNFITRKPTAMQVFDGQIGYGAQDSLRAAAGAGGPLGSMFSYRVDASYLRSDGYVDRGRSHSIATSGELRFAPSDAFAISLRDDYGDQHPMRYFGTPLIAGQLLDANQRRNYDVADGELHYRDNRTTLRADATLAEGLTLTNAAYRLTSKRLFKNLESYFYDASTGRIDREDNLGIIHDQVQYGDQGSIKLSTPIGAMHNDLVVGFDANLIKLTYSNDFGSDPQSDLVDPFNFNPGLFFDTQGIAPRYRTRTTEYSMFAEDRLALTERLSIVGGVNYERDRVRRWNITYNAAGAPIETFVFDKKLHNVSYRGGMVYQPAATVSLYATYTTGVDPLGTLTTFSPAQTVFKNTTGSQIEGGVKASFLGGRGNATLAAYRIVKHNLLVRDPTDLRNTTLLQVGSRSSRGIEASVSLDVAGGFGIEANGSLLNARFDEFNTGGVSYNGRTPPNTPEASGNLWLRYSGIARFQARAGLRVVGRTFSDNANAFRVPGYAVVDGTLSYAVTPKLAFDVRVYNLLDKDYASTTYNDEQWILGRPRSIDVSLRASF